MPKPTYPYKIRIGLTDDQGQTLQRLSDEQRQPITALIRDYVADGIAKATGDPSALANITLDESHVRALQIMAARDPHGPLSVEQMVTRILSRAIDDAGLTFAPARVQGRMVLIPVDVVEDDQ